MTKTAKKRCNIDALPEEIRQAKRFFPVAIVKDEKLPRVKQWNNPEKQKYAKDCDAPLLGFDICGHGAGKDYVVFDFDHVLDQDGNFTSHEAEAAYRQIYSLIGTTWAEVSISGSGIHIVGSPTPGKFKELTNNANGVMYFPEGGRVELFYLTSGRYFLLTGHAFQKAPPEIADGESVDSAIDWTLKRIAAQLAERTKVQPRPEAPLPKSSQDTDRWEVPDDYRVKAMLAAIPCADCTYTDWIHVGMVIQAAGLSVEDWDEWSAQDSSRYKGIADLKKHWKTFRSKDNGVSFGTLYNMAVRYGYDAKATAQAWYQEQDIDGFPDLGDDDDEADEKPSDFFNIEVLQKTDPQEVFICTGVFNAHAFSAVGAKAIALSRLDDVPKFIKKLKKDRPKDAITFIIALDNDDEGKRRGRELAAALRALGLSYIMGDVYGEAKDAKEAICQDKDAFSAAVKEACRRAARPDNVSDYISFFMGADMERFNVERKTGFPSFDLVTGGLYSGLYVIAAISSLGKTDYALQLADQLAAKGENVLFFSLEMSRLELVSRSIARAIAQEYLDKKIVTSTDIRKGRIPKDVLPAVTKYQERIGDRLSIVEGNFEADISFIADYTRRYEARTGSRPVVIIDYLQIISPMDDDTKRGKREAIDNTTTELKRFSRELDTPVIVISSVNRANYQTPIAFESLKESGNIEFSADCVFGLQLQCLNDPLFEADKKTVEKRQRVEAAKNELPRKIELVCLKNRFGKSFSLLYDYHCNCSLFVDMGAKDTTKRHYTPKAGQTL